MALGALRQRGAWVLLHRYVGLVMAGFLFIAGITGVPLAFLNELEDWLNPQLFHTAAPAPQARPIDPLVLRERVQALYPQALAESVDLTAPQPGRTVVFFVEGRPDPKTADHADIANDEVFMDPYSGKVVGERKWGDLSQGLVKNLMPFIERLHFQLALGVVGRYAFGVIALLWTVDCFVGAYLSMPAAAGRQAPGAGHWLRRWWPAWKLRLNRGPYKLNYDLHRAGGLWPWAMLFVLAWSSVALNLGEVYRPVMGLFFDAQSEGEKRHFEPGQAPEGMAWPQALATGRVLMAGLAERKGFKVLHEQRLMYDSHTHSFLYWVKSTRDIHDRMGRTLVSFDAANGGLIASDLPTGEASADTISTWLVTLHRAAVGGLPMKIFIGAMGAGVALLSVTGVVVWVRKRRSRIRSRAGKT